MPSLASAAEATTKRKIAQWVKNALLNLLISMQPDWSGEDGASLIMVHDEETNVSTEHHKRKFAGTVIVHDTSGFVGKSSKSEDVGNQVLVHVIDDVKVGFGVGDVVNVDGRYEAGHDGA